MSEWWTYRLSDFLMFSPRTYWRLVELYQRDVWPLQLLALGIGIALLWLAARRPQGAVRAICAVLALAWLWVGWAFHLERYATVNWAARYLAAAFALEALLLVVLGALRPGPPPRSKRDRGRTPGLFLAACGILLYPTGILLAGRPLAQAEIFGVMPEPTALGSVGLLLAAGPARRNWLLIIPVISLVIGAATRWLLAA
jgi:hypothetical protein